MALILRNGGSQSPDRWLKEPRNNHPYEDFVLAGVVAKQELDVSFEELARLLKLQKNVTEIKFKISFQKVIF